MNNKQTGTKEKILYAACDLFAKDGFAGTSVRIIAKEANVNIAAVNYHFNSKENLYWQTFAKGIDYVESQMNDLDTSLPIEDFVWEMFNVMIKNNTIMINTFRMMLSGGPAITPEYESFCQRGELGPPGTAILIKAIAPNTKIKNKEAIMWAIHSIFNCLIHTALMSQTVYVQKVYEGTDQLTDKKLKLTIVQHTKAIINHLNANTFPES